jgi:diacylglycerol O-acyltransferase / wax synthase
VLALALARRAFNVVVTNVPGPPVPLYLRASRMTAFHPIVNLWPGGGLGIALLSYNGTLYVGLHGDPQVVGDDLAPLTSDILESFAELRALARARPTPVERPAPQPPLHPLHPE